MGITYFCTDADGNTYNRFSKDHDAPRYRFADINRPKGERASKSGVGYTSKPVMPHDPAPLQVWHGVSWYCETVPVRAYPGRHTKEPVGNYPIK